MMRFNSLSIWLTVWGLLALPGMSSAEELPIPIKALEARGVTIVGQFAAPGGLKGYAARYNGQGMALYLTEDGQHVLVGTLFDARGEDLTRAPMDKLVYEPMAKEMWARMEKSTWISDGRDDAPRVVYLFDDPNCPTATCSGSRLGLGSTLARCSYAISWSACSVRTAQAKLRLC